MKKLLNDLKIARSLLRTATYLLLILYLTIGYLLGLIASGQGMVDVDYRLITRLAGCAAMIAGWYIFGSGLNDYADYEIDLINLKGDVDRPLVVGTATRHQLLRVVLLSGGSALIIAGLLSLQHLLLLVPLLVLGVSYSLKPLQISRRGGLAPLLLPTGYVVLPFYAGFLLSSHNYANHLLIAVMAAYYLHFMSRIILKDYRDVKGDKAHGKMTFLLRHGNQAVCAVSAICVSFSTIVCIYALADYGKIFVYGLVFFLSFVLSLLLQLSKTTVWKQQKPILAVFGRAMTAITALTIMSLMNALYHFPGASQVGIVAIIVVVYVWSANQAYAYNAAQLR
jgi:4-hydroxybenzoate polyprenyltransferase